MSSGVIVALWGQVWRKERKKRMKRNRTFLVARLLLLFAGIAAVVFVGINGRSYELHLPAKEKLAGISVEKGSKQAEITEDKKIEDLLYALSGGGGDRKTKKESVSDEPVNVQESLKVDFHFAESGTSTLFVYQKGGGYYVEQPYNGIYKISGEEYNTVEKYVR